MYASVMGWCKYVLTKFLEVSLLLMWMSRVNGQDRDQCINHLPSLAVPKHGVHSLSRQVQVVIPAYMITCHGSITQWSALMSGRMPATVIFQVWRMGGPGYYRLVGANELGEVEEGGLPPDKVTLVVPDQLKIQVQPGDVVGFYVGGEGDVRMKYSTSGNDVSVVMYIKEGIAGSLSTFYLPEINPSFSRSLLGSPLVEAVVEKEDTTPMPSPVVNLKNHSTAVLSSSISPSSSSTIEHPKTVSSSAVPSSVVEENRSGQLSTRYVILITSSVTVAILLCIIVLVLVVLCCCKRDRRKRRRREATPSQELESSQNDSFISSLASSVSIRFQRLMPGRSAVASHQCLPNSPCHENRLPPRLRSRIPHSTATQVSSSRTGDTRGGTSFEESDYVVMEGGNGASFCDGSQIDLCQEESLELKSNPCYTPSLSRQSIPLPEKPQVVYDVPKQQLGPVVGDYGVTVSNEYEQFHTDMSSNVYECIDGESNIYAEIK